MLGHGHVMRDQHHGVAFGMQFAEDLHHFLAGLGVQCAGRLIGEDHRAAVHQCTRDGHALLLPAGQLAGQVLHAFAPAQPLQQRLGAGMAVGAGLAGIDGRHFHVAQRGQVGQQVVALEDEAEVLAA
ncbi:hypothetical protein G6F57_016230 [Rhizopus arrhizus]|nr:hypothetical protein G6F57_016230 [Rhizopus arrhizus]